MNIMDSLKILNVTTESSIDDIKKSYRLLCKKYHPDVYKGNDSKIKEVIEAYRVINKYVSDGGLIGQDSLQGYPREDMNCGGDSWGIQVDEWYRVYDKQKEHRYNKSILVIGLDDLCRLYANDSYLSVNELGTKVYKCDLDKYNLLLKVVVDINTISDVERCENEYNRTVKFNTDTKKIVLNGIMVEDGSYGKVIDFEIKLLGQCKKIKTSANKLRTKFEVCGIEIEVEIERVPTKI